MSILNIKDIYTIENNGEHIKKVFSGNSSIYEWKPNLCPYTDISEDIVGRWSGWPSSMSPAQATGSYLEIKFPETGRANGGIVSPIFTATLLQGHTYTISFRIQKDGTELLNYLFILNNTNNFHFSTFPDITNANNEFVNVSVTFTPSYDMLNPRLMIGDQTSTNSTYIRVKNVKVEESKYQTTWIAD